MGMLLFLHLLLHLSIILIYFIIVEGNTSVKNNLNLNSFIISKVNDPSLLTREELKDSNFQNLIELRNIILNWSALNGLVMKAPKKEEEEEEEEEEQQQQKQPPVVSSSKKRKIIPSFKRNELSHLPISILPTKLPKEAFEKVKIIQPILNKLVDRISRDPIWLSKTLRLIAKSDGFTKRLLDLYTALEKGDYKSNFGNLQKLSLGIHRSDYMLDSRNGKMFQIELNTISSSFGCLADVLSKLHHLILKRQEKVYENTNTEKNYFLDQFFKTKGFIPNNSNTRTITNALAKAHKKLNHSNACILFVVQEDERNSIDQAALESQLWKDYHIITKRLTLAQIADRGKLVHDKSTNISQFYLDDGTEDQIVSVVYFRAGYGPCDYPTEKEWHAREMIEISSAIKCPNIGYQLAGTKKVQQALSNVNNLKRFLSEKESLLISKHFTGLYSLYNDNSKSLNDEAKNAILHPNDYVLKPQREGGGNNLYNHEISKALQEWDFEKLSGYILMEKIRPNETPSLFMRDGLFIYDKAISEIGIFGTYIGDGERIFLNEYAGYLVRSKSSSSNEGGVASGHAVLDSCYLTEE